MTTDYAGYGVRERLVMPARALDADPPQRLQAMLAKGAAALAQPYMGITTDGQVTAGLFARAESGVSTAPVVAAANAFLASLDASQRSVAQFDVENDAWRSWVNVHMYMMRHGALLEDLNDRQRDAALALLRESLSAAGFATARDILKLNETMAEVAENTVEYGEWLYWLSIMGTPSADQPWGWQIDGHHLNVNFFVLGDQVVMTPTFMGSEPVYATTGKHAGTRVFEAEETNGLSLVQSLSKEQQAKAIVCASVLRADVPPDRLHGGDGHVEATAFSDNKQLAYEGIRGDELSDGQRDLLRALLKTYVGRMRDGHAEVKMAEVEHHLAETHFSWMGGTEQDSAFYYRLHSPVILIEFDHQAGIAFDNDEPSRLHIHTVVRTPNGNDYGKDLLRQHYEAFDHARA